MTEKQPADMGPEENRPHESWTDPKVTAVLVLADGTVLEG